MGFTDSWYHHTAHSYTPFAALSESSEADVCIVGGGYTGLSAAIELAQNGYRVVVLEAHKVGSGASGRNGGVLGTGQRKDQDELESWLGKDDARLMWQIADDANQLVRDRIKRFGIDCQLRDGELVVAHKEKYEQELWDYAQYLEQEYAYPHKRCVTRDEVADMLGNDVYFGGYVDTRAGHIHPLNLAIGLAQAAERLGVQIHEDSRVTEMHRQPDGVVMRTRSGQVKARFGILGCNGYLGRLDKGMERYQMPINNFVAATVPLGEEGAKAINRDNLAVVDTRFVVNYFHNSADHRLIFGGGENYSSWFPKDIHAFVRKRMEMVYPQLKGVEIEFGWGGTLAITMRRMPHFGRYGDNVYYAQGYSGHGIAMANMGGLLAAQAIMGQAERFDLFANLKHQSFPGGRWLRWPGLVAGMLYYSMKDRF